MKPLQSISQSIGKAFAACRSIFSRSGTEARSSGGKPGHAPDRDQSAAPGRWLDSYTGQTTDELIQLESEYRIDSLVLAFEQAVDQKAARLGEDAISEEERFILAVEALEREVNNGGYGQFFLNSSNEYAAVIVDALDRIDCPNTARITRAAIDALAVDGDPTSEVVENAIREDNPRRDKLLGELDDQYYRNDEEIADRLFAFIKANRDRIVLP